MIVRNAGRVRRRRMGDWSFTRYLRNQGVQFETALFIVTGRRSAVVR